MGTPFWIVATACANCGGFSRSSLKTVLLMRLYDFPPPARNTSVPDDLGSHVIPSRGAKLFQSVLNS